MIKSKAIFFLILTLLFFNSEIQSQQGFFIDGWSSKNIESPVYIDVDKSDSLADVSIVVNFADTLSKVSKYIYGNNANVYSTKMWDNPGLIENIRNLNPHVIRFPGGNLSNVYFWDVPPGTVLSDVPSNIDIWAGKNYENWTMSVDDYYRFLDSANSEGSICVNYSYARYGMSADPVAAAAHQAAEWVRYDNGKTLFWEIGNENYGSWQAGYQIDVSLNQDSQPEFINGTLYGTHCRVFIDSMRSAAAEIDHNIKIGVVLFDSPGSGNTIESQWNDKVIAEVIDYADFYIVHNYFTPYNQNSVAYAILSSYTKVKTIRDYIEGSFTKLGRELGPLVFNEWNIFAIGSQQAVSHINGVHAVLLLGSFIKEKFGLTARWNLANSWENGDDHGMFSQGGEPGVSLFTPRPAFFYMTYFQKYFGDVMVQSSVYGNGNILAFASKFNSEHAGLVIVNKGPTNRVVDIETQNFEVGSRIYWYNFEGELSDGSFSRKVFINGEGPAQIAGGPDNYLEIPAYSYTYYGTMKIQSPAYSVQFVIVEGNTLPTSIEEDVQDVTITDKFNLYQNYPNPFNPSTIINYSISTPPQPSPYQGEGIREGFFISLKVYDILGREVVILVNEKQKPGNYEIIWDASTYPSGIYFYRLHVGNNVLTRKMTLLK
jgi:hypothetical protein